MPGLCDNNCDAPRMLIGTTRRTSWQPSQHNNTTNTINSLIMGINQHVAQFRELLIHIGHPRDCQEMRENIRKMRRKCVEGCKKAHNLIMPQLRRASMEGMPVDNPNLVLLYYETQYVLNELSKCYTLIQVIPMDMTGYYDGFAATPNFGNVISQILLCKNITLDFHKEELSSITKDSQDLALILSLMQEFMPKQDESLEKSAALQVDVNKPWATKRRRNSLYDTMGFFCCLRKNYS